MQHYAYITTLLVSLAGISAYDSRHTKIIFSGKQFFIPVFSTMAVLLIADVIGIALNIFQTNQEYVSGLFIVTPNLPIEELLLLIMLPYLALVIAAIVKKHL